MRATRSDDTMLEGTFVPDQPIARVVSSGAAGIDLFVLGIFAWAGPTFGNIVLWHGPARLWTGPLRMSRRKCPWAMSRSMAYHAEVQHAIAEMAIELGAIGPHLDKIAQDWSGGADHGMLWGAKLVAVKYRDVEGAWRVVDMALELAGGFGIFKQSGIERSSAMHGWVALTRRTPFLVVNSQPRPCSRSALTNNRAGVKPSGLPRPPVGSGVEAVGRSLRPAA